MRRIFYLAAILGICLGGCNSISTLPNNIIDDITQTPYIDLLSTNTQTKRTKTELAEYPSTNPTTASTVSKTITIPSLPTTEENLDASTFGNPILEIIKNLPYTFYDDFSTNKGWIASWGGINPPARSEMMSIEGGYIQAINDGNRVYTQLAPPYGGNYHNYVLTVEATFMASTNLNRDRDIGICWVPENGKAERFLLNEKGIYEGSTCDGTGCEDPYNNGKLSPILIDETITIILIKKDGESAIYVNNIPVVYQKVGIIYRELGFTLCPHTFDGYQSNIKYDNVKIWKL